MVKMALELQSGMAPGVATMVTRMGYGSCFHRRAYQGREEAEEGEVEQRREMVLEVETAVRRRKSSQVGEKTL